jgi:hypothetical protein
VWLHNQTDGTVGYWNIKNGAPVWVYEGVLPAAWQETGIGNFTKSV